MNEDLFYSPYSEIKETTNSGIALDTFFIKNRHLK